MKITMKGSPSELRAFLVPGSVDPEPQIKPPTPAPVVAPVDPVSTAPAAPHPASTPSAQEAREAFDYFRSCLLEWIRGFEKPDQPQPDRIDIIRRMGSGRMMIPVMKLALERGSLQKLISECLKDTRSPSMPLEEWLEYVQRISAQMVAISHMGFPDLEGMHDYSTRWRRTYVD